MNDRNYLFSAISSFLIISLAASVHASDVTVELLDNSKIQGQLIKIDPSTIDVLKPGQATPTSIPTPNVGMVQISKAPLPPKETKYDRIELSDGSIVLVAKLSFQGKQAVPTVLTSAHTDAVVPEIELATSMLSQWLRNAHDPANVTAWNQLAQKRTKQDTIVLKQADGFNALTGTLLNASETGDLLPFEQADGTQINLRVNRITGGIFFFQPAQALTAPTLCQVVDHFGNRWVATKLELTTTSSGSASLLVTTVAGAKIRYPKLSSVAQLDFALGNMLYLSDLTAKIVYPEVEESKAMGPEFALARKVVPDQAGGGQPLIIQGKRFAKGLSIPPGTSLTYTLDGTYREFRFVPGAGANSALLPLSIELDGRLVYTVPDDLSSRGKEFTINIKDARELKLIVGTGFFTADRILLGDARLQK